MKQYAVCILASHKNGTLYIGVTGNLERRIQQHKLKSYPESFSAKYGVVNLVWYECTNNVESVLQLEKKLKSWDRKWKLDLIEKHNHWWKDLSVGEKFLDSRSSLE